MNAAAATANEPSTVTAKVETPSGMKIELTGSRQEVEAVLAFLSGSPRKERRQLGRHARQPIAPGGKWKSVVAELAREGFFAGNERTIGEIAARVNEKGYNVRGRIVGALASALTLACRDADIKLQRRHLGKGERKGKEQWVFFSKK